jgi:hypothetical protein
LKELNKGGIGAYNSCISVKNDRLLFGSSKDDFIGEYNKLEFDKTWFFEGKKTIVKYLNNYILFVIYGKSESSLQIYDIENQFFVYYKMDKNKILSVCNDEEYLYIFCEESMNKKYIEKLKEKNKKDKLEVFYEKKFFSDALIYAENIKLSDKEKAEISKKHAEYEYYKGSYDKAIDEYIKILNYTEPSVIIQKFADKSKLLYLIKYLEAIVYSPDFKNKDNDENKNYTTLLLHCYIMQEEIPKLKEFIDKNINDFSIDIIKNVVEVCLETDKYELGLSIAQQYKLIDEYFYINIIKLNNLEDSLNIIENPNEIDFELTYSNKVDIYCKYAEYFLKSSKNEDNKEDLGDKFFSSVLDFIQNEKQLKKEEKVKLIEIFLDSDKCFKKIFEKMDSYH